MRSAVERALHPGTDDLTERSSTNRHLLQKDVGETHQVRVGQNSPQDRFRPAPQSGISGTLRRTNPFYANYLESNNEYVKESMGSKAFHTDEPIVDHGGGFSDFPNGHFQVSTSSDTPGHAQTSTVTRYTSADDRFPDKTLTSERLSKPVPPQPKSRSTTWLLKTADHFRGLVQADDEDDLPPVERSREENLFDKSPNGHANPFKSPSDKKEDLVWSPRRIAGHSFDATAVDTADLFQTAPTKSEKISHTKEEWFTKEDLLNTSYKNNLFNSTPRGTSDSIPNPVKRDLFPDFSSLDDPLGKTPPRYDPPPYTPKAAQDIFQPLHSWSTNEDVFPMTSSNPDSKCSTSLLTSRSEVKSDMLPNYQDLFKAVPSGSQPTPPPKPTWTSCDDITTTLQETESDLQPTPFTRARNLCLSPGQAQSTLTHVPNFRRPPKPLPRKRTRREKPPVPERPLVPERPPVPEKPPVPERPLVPEKPPVPEKPLVQEKPPVPGKPLTPVKHVVHDGIFANPPPKADLRPTPKPVVPHKPQTLERKPVEPEDCVFLQEIVFIGQEKCVEDWPENSPMLQPNFKPSGKLKLRRESMKIKTDSEGGSGEDPDGSGSFSKKKDKRILTLISRRGSKDKFPDEKEGKSKTLPNRTKLSKGYYSDTHVSAGENDEEEQNGQEYKQKKPLKGKLSKLLRRTSTASYVSDEKMMNGYLPQDRWQDKIPDAHDFTSFRTHQAASMGDDDDGDYNDGDDIAVSGFNGEPHLTEGTNPQKKSKRKGLLSKSRKLKHSSGHGGQLGYDVPNEASYDVFVEDNLSPAAADGVARPGETYDGHHDDLETSKPQKKVSKRKTFKFRKFSRKSSHPEAAAMSEAARAEWMSAQIDEQGEGDEEHDEEDGDTDSLMEWWYTVEQWDEVPSDEEDNSKIQSDSESFTILADKIVRGLRVFNKVFTERAEVLWQYVIMLHAIADDIANFHQKALVAGITGGTTTAVGGATAIAGLALAPFTFGFSLILTAVGVGVATAGGITTASAAISDSVNNMQDSKKVEIILKEYEAHLLDIGKILHFLNQGLYKIRGHPFLRSGTQHYSEDWEIRRAVQIISLVDSPVMRATEITDSAVASVQALFKGMDQYFTKESRELKKGCNNEVVSRIKWVANSLLNGITALNNIRDELQDATGGM